MDATQSPRDTGKDRASQAPVLYINGHRPPISHMLGDKAAATFIGEEAFLPQPPDQADCRARNSHD